MRSDNMPRPFAPEHGEEAASQLQRDIELVEVAVVDRGLADENAAWQRLKPRLTPDREQLAIKMYCNYHRWQQGRIGYWINTPERVQNDWRAKADAAIDAIKETP